MSIVLAPAARASQWRAVLPALLVTLAAILLVYRDTLAAMVQIWWRSETFTHAFLVLPIALWLVWRDRARIAAQAPAPAPWLLLPIAGVAAAWLLGEALLANALSQFAVVALLVLTVAALVGRAATRAMLFPLAFLLFAVPVGDFMLPVLMSSTADFTVGALRMSGIPVYREGQHFMIPSGQWSVVEACSGVRYLIASAMVGTLFAYLNFRSLRKRLMFLAAALIVPVFANWLRAYMIVMIGHLSSNRLAVGVDHLIYGWLFFGVVIITLFFIGARWADASRSPVDPPRRAQAVDGGPGSEPSGGKAWGVGLAAMLLLTLPPFANVASNERAWGPSSAEAMRAPDIAGWRRTEPAAGFKPVYHEPNGEWQAGYERDGRLVTAYVAYYRGQDRQRKLIGSHNVIAATTDDLWSVVGARRETLDLPDGPREVESTQLRALPGFGQQQERLAWRIFLVGGEWTARESTARLLTARQRLLGRGDDGAVLVISGDDRAALQSFLASGLPVIERRLAAAHAAH